MGRGRGLFCTSPPNRIRIHFKCLFSVMVAQTPDQRSNGNMLSIGRISTGEILHACILYNVADSTAYAKMSSCSCHPCCLSLPSCGKLLTAPHRQQSREQQVQCRPRTLKVLSLPSVSSLGALLTNSLSTESCGRGTRGGGAAWDHRNEIRCAPPTCPGFSLMSSSTQESWCSKCA